MRIDLDLKADAFTVTYRPRKVQPAAMLAAIRALGFEATVLDTAPAVDPVPGVSPTGTVREISPGATVRNLPPAVAARLQEAQAAGRLALLEFHATWCAPCRVVEREVLPHPRVMAALAGYEMVRLDMDSPGGERAAHILQVEAMPALLVLDGCGRERERFLGVPDPEQLARRLGELAAAPSPQCPARSSR